jgi:hypothetical protein
MIAVSGMIGSGKTFLAEKVLQRMIPGSLVLGFGDHMKIELARRKEYLIPWENLFRRKDYKTRKTMLAYSANEQRINGPSVWVTAFDAWMKLLKSRGIKCFIVHDLRYMHEVDYLRKNNAILIKVISPRRTMIKISNECSGDKLKMSEILDIDLNRELPDELFDYVYENDEPNAEKKLDDFLKVALKEHGIQTETK